MALEQQQVAAEKAQEAREAAMQEAQFHRKSALRQRKKRRLKEYITATAAQHKDGGRKCGAQRR
jgi:hypothetical protein